MAKGPLAGVINLFNRLFPERQLYHRSHGQVRFVSMSAQTQIALLIVTLAFLAWVAYASVNVVFKEQIISAKERNLVAMQANYEVRLAAAQAAYERLHTFLIEAEDRFQRETELLRLKQSHLEQLVDRKEQIGRDYASLQTKISVAKDEPPLPADQSRMMMEVTALDPTPRISRSTLTETKAEGIKILGTIAALAIPKPNEKLPVAASTTNQFSHLDAKIAGMRAAQRDMVMRFEEGVEHDIDKVTAILSLTQLNVDELADHARKEDAARGTGGPLFTLDDMATQLQNDPTGDQFSRQMLRLSDKIDRLTYLSEALERTPLVKPVLGLPISSGFGPRLDPFTHRVAFHSGTDFPGPYNTPVYSTAAGTVSRAGRFSAYGRLVEIDHGFGYKTRYGHLNEIKVEVGDNVKFRQEIGLMGSTGRSTGPHVHYEVWYEGNVLDAEHFIEAGRYVFQE